MGVRPASNALAKARTSYTVALVSEMLRTALLPTYVVSPSTCEIGFLFLAVSRHPTCS